MPFHSRLVLADAHNDEINPTWTVHYIVEDDLHFGMFAFTRLNS